MQVAHPNGCSSCWWIGAEAVQLADRISSSGLDVERYDILVAGRRVGRCDSPQAFRVVVTIDTDWIAVVRGEGKRPIDSKRGWTRLLDIGRGKANLAARPDAIVRTLDW